MDESRKVLWVDDQIDGLTPYVDALREEGVKLDTALSCEEAVSLLKSGTYDAVIVDLRMPEKDGIEVIRNVIRFRKGTNICAYSSYLYLDEYIARLRGLNLPI